MNRNYNSKSLQERKQELDLLRTEWKEMKKQEENLKKEFYASPKNSSERARIKNQLTPLQREIFDKGHCGRCQRSEIEKDELFEKAQNSTEPITDPARLAHLIKEELRAVLNGTRQTRLGKGDTVGDIMEVGRGEAFWTFTDHKEIKKGIENLPRVREKELNRDNMSIRGTEVKRKDLSPADFDEIISLIRQVKDFLEKKDKQDRQQTKNIKLNNPHLFTQWKCSTDKRNGVRRWENWHTFSGKHNGFDYTIYVPDEHFALTNVLFNDGWGTNSEIEKFFVVEGVAAPQKLHYWNVAQQKSEIISEAEGQRLIKQAEGNYVSYHTYVDLNDKISIDHHQESGQLYVANSAETVSGVNQGLIENNDRQNMSGGGSMVTANPDRQVKNDNPVKFLLEYFRKNDIQKISLTPEGELAIEYKDNRTEIANKNDSSAMKDFLHEKGQLSLNYSQLTELASANNSLGNPQSRKPLIIGGAVALTLAIVVGLSYYLVTKTYKKSPKKGQ